MTLETSMSEEQTSGNAIPIETYSNEDDDATERKIVIRLQKDGALSYESTNISEVECVGALSIVLKSIEASLVPNRKIDAIMKAVTSGNGNENKNASELLKKVTNSLKELEGYVQ